MISLRPAAVAGMFYPADPVVLRSTVDHLLASVPAASADVSPALKALIVPHAGYVYSGPIAAQCVRPACAPARDAIQRVVLLGPAHRVPLRGLALPGAQAFATPLGTVDVDPAVAAASLRSAAGVRQARCARARAFARGAAAVSADACSATSRCVPLVGRRRRRRARSRECSKRSGAARRR